MDLTPSIILSTPPLLPVTSENDKPFGGLVDPRDLRIKWDLLVSEEKQFVLKEERNHLLGDEVNIEEEDFQCLLSHYKQCINQINTRQNMY